MSEQGASAPSAEDAADALRITKAELEFGHAFWQRDYEAAAKALDKDIDLTFESSRPTGAWHSLWIGYCYEILGDKDARTCTTHGHTALR
jgi:hypothetical protein